MMKYSDAQAEVKDRPSSLRQVNGLGWKRSGIHQQRKLLLSQWQPVTVLRAVGTSQLGNLFRQALLQPLAVEQAQRADGTQSDPWQARERLQEMFLQGGTDERLAAQESGARLGVAEAMPWQAANS